MIQYDRNRQSESIPSDIKNTVSNNVSKCIGNSEASSSPKFTVEPELSSDMDDTTKGVSGSANHSDDTKSYADVVRSTGVVDKHAEKIALENAKYLQNANKKMKSANKQKVIREDKKVNEVKNFIQSRKVLMSMVRDAVSLAQDRQKEYADTKGRKNINIFNVGDKVLLNTCNLSTAILPQVGSNKLLPRYIGPYTVLECYGNSYKLDIPKSLNVHPTFYVGRLKPYLPSEIVEIVEKNSSQKDIAGATKSLVLPE